MLDVDRPAARWLDAFLAAYYARHPVNATFIGVHDYDRALPDFSTSAGAELTALLDAVPDLEPVAPLPGGAHDQPQHVIDALDLELAAGSLRIALAEHDSLHFQNGNPAVFTGEGVFGVVSLLLSQHAPAADRLDAAIARMNIIPDFLMQARAIRGAPAAWTQRALRECTGAREIFEGGVQAFAREHDVVDDRLEAAARGAADAFAAFAARLRELPDEAEYACGSALFELYLREGHRLVEDADDVLGLARQTLIDVTCRRDDRLAELGIDGVDALNEALADSHPGANGYLDRFGEIHDEMHRIALDHDLVTWPDAPLRFVFRPSWVRAAAPYLYFLFYRSPAAFGRPAVHEHLLTPLDAGDVDSHLRATNDATIRLNHVVHHAGLGHHVQNAHAFRSPSRIGRIAAVDCASRIALFCGGTMAEGWACYATELMSEIGVLSPLEEVAELHSTVRMCARAIVDVELHRGAMTFDDAVRFYAGSAAMPSAAAHAEVVKNAMNPGTALMYFMGVHGIRELRRHMEARLGAAFSLHRFHDELLSWGSVPIAAIARRMRDAL